jgi:hypothetical protein
LNEALSALTPDQPVSRLVISKTAGGGASTGFQVIEIGLAGDHNLDGTVNAADYVTWRKNPPAFGGDPTGYSNWRSNFGAESGSGGGYNYVPEPSVLALIGVTLSLITARPRMRQ